VTFFFVFLGRMSRTMKTTMLTFFLLSGVIAVISDESSTGTTFLRKSKPVAPVAHFTPKTSDGCDSGSYVQSADTCPEGKVEVPCDYIDAHSADICSDSSNVASGWTIQNSFSGGSCSLKGQLYGCVYSDSSDSGADGSVLCCDWTGAPVSAPVQSPEWSPVHSPELAPVQSPEWAPVQSPEWAPVQSPVQPDEGCVPGSYVQNADTCPDGKEEVPCDYIDSHSADICTDSSDIASGWTIQNSFSGGSCSLKGQSYGCIYSPSSDSGAGANVLCCTWAGASAPVFSPVQSPEWSPVQSPEWAPVQSPEWAPVDSPVQLPTSDLSHYKICDRGNYFDEVTQDCAQCPQGSYSDAFGATACVLCPPGYSQYGVGATSCNSCGYGSYSQGFGNIDCPICEDGTYSQYNSSNNQGFPYSNGGAMFCDSCPENSYANYYHTGCVECPDGTFPYEDACRVLRDYVVGSWIGVTFFEDYQCQTPDFIPLPSMGNLFFKDGECIGLDDNTNVVYTYDWYTSEVYKSTYSHEDIYCDQEPLSEIESFSVSECYPDDQDSYMYVQPTSSFEGQPDGALILEEGVYDVLFDSQATCDGRDFQSAISISQITAEYFAVNVLALPDATNFTLTCVDDNTALGVVDTPGGASYTEVLNYVCYQYQNGYRVTLCLSGRTDCPDGTTVDFQNSGSCSLCVAGRFSNNETQFQCEACPAGSFSAEGSSECTLCPAGYFSYAGSSSCFPCGYGQYNSQPGQTECSLCPAGTFTSFNTTSALDDQFRGGYMSCVQCEDNQIGNEAYGSSRCVDCPNGSHANFDWTECVTDEKDNQGNCLPGSELNSDGSGDCMECMPGYYAPDGTTGCFSCAPGTYSGVPGSTECTDCPAGYVSFSYGSSSCYTCSYGSFSSEPGAAYCLGCPAGSFAPGENVTTPFALQQSDSPSAYATQAPGRFWGGYDSCLQCPEGFISSNTYSQSCTKCDYPAIANSDQTECILSCEVQLPEVQAQLQEANNTITMLLEEIAVLRRQVRVTHSPTPKPSRRPSFLPTRHPTVAPTTKPTHLPTAFPTHRWQRPTSDYPTSDYPVSRKTLSQIVPGASHATPTIAYYLSVHQVVLGADEAVFSVPAITHAYVDTLSAALSSSVANSSPVKVLSSHKQSSAISHTKSGVKVDVVVNAVSNLKDNSGVIIQSTVMVTNDFAVAAASGVEGVAPAATGIVGDDVVSQSVFTVTTGVNSFVSSGSFTTAFHGIASELAGKVVSSHPFIFSERPIISALSSPAVKVAKL